MAIKIPEIITTCSYDTYLENGTWYIRLKSSGTFAFRYAKTEVDIFLQAGGGGGGEGSLVSGDSFYNGGGGGAGGYQSTQYAQAISGTHEITIGAGGAVGQKGGTTSAFGFNATGGAPGGNITAGKAGTAAGGAGGKYHGDGVGDSGDDGKQGKQAFGTGDIYYGAGGGGAAASFGESSGKGGKTGGGAGFKNATANTGSGGGGEAKGGSGIVILRGAQDDQLPVKFDGVTLQRIVYNGQDVMHLIHDGTTIFMERIKEWLKPKMRFVLQET